MINEHAHTGILQSQHLPLNKIFQKYEKLNYLIFKTSKMYTI